MTILLLLLVLQYDVIINKLRKRITSYCRGYAIWCNPDVERNHLVFWDWNKPYSISFPEMVRDSSGSQSFQDYSAGGEGSEVTWRDVLAFSPYLGPSCFCRLNSLMNHHGILCMLILFSSWSHSRSCPWEDIFLIQSFKQPRCPLRNYSDTNKNRFFHFTTQETKWLHVYSTLKETGMLYSKQSMRKVTHERRV